MDTRQEADAKMAPLENLFDAAYKLPGVNLQVWEVNQPYAVDALQEWAREKGLSVKMTLRDRTPTSPSLDIFMVETEESTIEVFR